MRSLIKIAEKLDTAGLYKLSDKLFKIAQVSEYDDNIVYQPGPGFRTRKIVKDGNEYKSLDAEEYEQYKSNFQILNSLSTDDFTQKLFQFGRQNNMNNLTQAFDAYADAGAKLNGQSIKSNPVLRELYLWVKNTNEMITPQMLSETLNLLFGGSRDNSYKSIIYNKDRNELTFGNMPGLMKEPTNPSSYASYEDYLIENNKKRAPMGTNNDDQLRDKDYLLKQNDYMTEWKDSIDVYTNSNDLGQLQNLKNTINQDRTLTMNSKKTLLQYLNNKAKEIK
jgi:hypothetical protein